MCVFDCVSFSEIHRRSQRVHCVHVHSPGRRQNFGAKFTGESCKCTPRQKVHPPEAEQEFNFFEEIDGEIRTVGEVIRVVLASVLRAMTKKVVIFFGEVKCTPRQNHGYAYGEICLKFPQ